MIPQKICKKFRLLGFGVEKQNLIWLRLVALTVAPPQHWLLALGFGSGPLALSSSLFALALSFCLALAVAESECSVCGFGLALGS